MKRSEIDFSGKINGIAIGNLISSHILSRNAQRLLRSPLISIMVFQFAVAVASGRATYILYSKKSVERISYTKCKSKRNVRRSHAVSVIIILILAAPHILVPFPWS
jgi:hypothetical protein